MTLSKHTKIKFKYNVQRDYFQDVFHMITHIVSSELEDDIQFLYG